MSDATFPSYGKTPRLFRDMAVTEKIDGTNGLISITDVTAALESQGYDTPPGISMVHIPGAVLQVRAGSRNRWLDPWNKDGDNAGFAVWVHANNYALVEVLGVGNHYGEWWGEGIQRGYGVTGKRFSLFNVDRWKNLEDRLDLPDGLGVVPVLKRHTFDTVQVVECLAELAICGSMAAPGFMQPEGVVVWHGASRQVFKALIENDREPKSHVPLNMLPSKEALQLA